MTPQEIDELLAGVKQEMAQAGDVLARSRQAREDRQSGKNKADAQYEERRAQRQAARQAHRSDSRADQQ